MRFNTSLLILMCLALAGCRHPGVRGSGVERTEARQLGEFSEVEISGKFDIVIRCGQSPGATVVTDDNLIPLIKTEVRGSVLHIYPEKDVSPRTDLHIDVSTPSLSRVMVSGVVDLDIRKVQGERLSLGINGAATVVAEGEVRDAHFVISGAGRLASESLRCTDMHLVLSGAGKADVYASGDLDVTVSGAGSVHYTGSPRHISKHISGIGFVSEK